MHEAERRSAASHIAARAPWNRRPGGRGVPLCRLAGRRPGKPSGRCCRSGPTGYGESPYQLFSAFAGNPLLVSLDRLVERGPARSRLPGRIAARSPRTMSISIASDPGRRPCCGALSSASAQTRNSKQFRCSHSAWLDDFARFMALKEVNGGVSWTAWKYTGESGPARSGVPLLRAVRVLPPVVCV